MASKHRATCSLTSRASRRCGKRLSIGSFMARCTSRRLSLGTSAAHTLQPRASLTPRRLVATPRYSFDQMMNMKQEKEAEGKWVWKEGNWARKMDNRATKARIKKLELALKKIQEDDDATPRPVPRARNICTWIETDSEKDVWCCNNEVLRHPETNEMLYLCGYVCRLGSRVCACRRALLPTLLTGPPSTAPQVPCYTMCLPPPRRCGGC